MLKGNKGEWSEVYALCYLLNEGVLKAADRDLNPTNMYFPILKILREEIKGTVLHYFPADTDCDVIKVYDGETLLAVVEKGDLEKIVALLLDKIPAGEPGKRVFEIPEVNAFFDTIYVRKLKADSAHKQDIDIHIHDVQTGYDPICGFSIKSYLGATPSLWNSAEATSFIYTVENCNEEIASHFNSIHTRNKVIDRMRYLYGAGCSLSCLPSKKADREEKVHYYVESSRFQENLEFVDSRMPEILSYALMIWYRDRQTRLSAVVETLKKENPVKFSNAKMYEYKMKKFLCACALGMTAENVWEGAENANGGYIVVKKDGAVVCYHIYNRTEFEQYLYDYTKFDVPSTGRHGFMEIYPEKIEIDEMEKVIYKLKLNLQVRFV